MAKRKKWRGGIDNGLWGVEMKVGVWKAGELQTIRYTFIYKMKKQIPENSGAEKKIIFSTETKVYQHNALLKFCIIVLFLFSSVDYTQVPFRTD